MELHTPEMDGRQSQSNGDATTNITSRNAIAIALLALLGTFLIAWIGTAAWRTPKSNSDSIAPPPVGALVQPVDTSTAEVGPMPTELPPEVTKTPVPTAEAVTATEVVTLRQASVLALPTVTPTQELPPTPPRDVEIAGATTLRLALSGQDFESTGRPMNFSLEPRRYTLGLDELSTGDEWCLQLGLVNQGIDLDLSLNPQSEELTVAGGIALREGFCDDPGAILDETSVELQVPNDATAQISYNLRGRRSLFGITGLLDSDVGAIVELRVTNSRPR